MAPLRIPYRFLIAFLVVTGLFLCFLPLWDGAGKNGDYIDQAPYPHEVQNITTSTVQSLSHFTQGDTTFKPSKTAIPFGESSVNQTLHKYGKRAFKSDEDEDYDDETDDDDPAEYDEEEGMAVDDDEAGSTITLLTANQFALATAKGRNLLCMTRQSIADVTTQLSQQSLFAAGSTTSESLFTTYQALTANGYVSTNENSYLRLAYLERTGLGDTIFIKPAIEALGLSDAPLDEDGYNDVVEWKHSNPVTIQGTTYPVSKLAKMFVKYTDGDGLLTQVDRKPKGLSCKCTTLSKVPSLRGPLRVPMQRRVRRVSCLSLHSSNGPT